DTQVEAGYASGQHEKPDQHHDAERPEHGAYGWPIGGLPLPQPADLAVPIVGQNQAAQFGDADFEAVTLVNLVWNGEEYGGLPAARVPVAFHGGNLGRLMFERVESVQIADEDLQRGHNNDKSQPHGHAQTRMLMKSILEQIPCRYAGHHEGRGQKGGGEHMREPVREGGIEDHVPPALDKIATVFLQKAGGSLHPAV